MICFKSLRFRIPYSGKAAVRSLILPVILSLPFTTEAQQHPLHEMRAFWIATVSNIDWPSRQGQSTEDQQEELIGLFDLALKNNLNTIVLQVRPAADAFYASKFEPWSKWLTGTQGKAPDPYYDPLEFAVTECRKRGLDIHVWLNPYRALTDTALEVSENHITRLHPEWFVTYGRTVYFDPGRPETRDFVASVVGDIVRRYDIDAIHMDDYFYPYRIANVSFPDDSSFMKYGSGYDSLQRDDWRRENVNTIIRQLNDTIKSVKPWVEFGISPFGVWRNASVDSLGSNTRAGQTNYDDLFADILLWQRNGWIDYVVPQIYWHIGFELADYATLAEWWSRNAEGCMLYIGQAPYRIDRKAAARQWRKPKQIIRQIRLNRTMPEISGSMFFSARVFRNNPMNLSRKLTRDLYKYPALTPVNNRISPVYPGQPEDPLLEYDSGILTFTWKTPEGAADYVIYRLEKGKPSDLGNPANIIGVTAMNSFSLKSVPGSLDRYAYYITSRSRSNLESKAVRFIYRK